jgi:hypothetical protein
VHGFTSFLVFLELASLWGPGFPNLAPGLGALEQSHIMGAYMSDPGQGFIMGATSSLLSSWQCVGSHTKAMCKLPIKTTL